MTQTSIPELCERLNTIAETVCERILPNGKRYGNYWVTGNLNDDPGRSLFVRIRNGNAVGHWRDAATGEHGDMMDLIAHRYPGRQRAIYDIARSLVGNDQPVPTPDREHTYQDIIERIWIECTALPGTPAAEYLKGRGLALERDYKDLRYHRRLLYLDKTKGSSWHPGLVAGIRDNNGQLRGLHRTYLQRNGRNAEPSWIKLQGKEAKKALGAVRPGVRLEAADPSPQRIVVGEGIETVLSVTERSGHWDGIATLSAANLQDWTAPREARHILIAADHDPQGLGSAAVLAKRLALSESCGSVHLMVPLGNDFNEDLQEQGITAVRDHILKYLKPKP